MPLKKLIEIGKALKPFGIKGEIKIRPFTESPVAFENSSILIIDESQYPVTSVRMHKGNVLVKLEGIDTPEKAAELSGCLVRTGEENLPDKEEDEYYWYELIGMNVVTVKGESLGEVKEIIPTGANDVLSIEGDYGEVLLPVIDQVIIEIDNQNNTILVDPLDGLIPDA